MENWFAVMGRYLGGWPAHYLCLDIETCGGLQVSSPRVLPIELGWCLVEDGAVVVNEALVLDWTRDPAVDVTQLTMDLAKTGAAMRSHGAAYRFSTQLLARDGVCPREGLAALAGLLANAAAADYALVTWNGFAFDWPIVDRCLRTAGIAPRWPVQIDAGLIEKARGRQILPPEPGALPRSAWYGQVADRRGKGKWNLHPHATGLYEVAVDPSQAHGAGYDALLTHCVLAAMNRLATGGGDPCRDAVATAPSTT